MTSRTMSKTYSKDRSPLLLFAGAAAADANSASKAEDYLNDRIQAQGDFTSYDELLTKVEAQRVQLESQYQVAQEQLRRAQATKADQLSILDKQKKDFEARQDNIDRHLAIVTASDAPDEAVEMLRSPMEKLRKLELAHLYVELLQEIDNLAEKSRSFLPANPKEALQPYLRLRDMSKAVAASRSSADGAAIHLTEYIDHKTAHLWQDMQRIMSEEFYQVLESQNYPATELEATKDFKRCFNKMLDLQETDMLSLHENIVLLPFAVLTEPFRTRFRYHFLDVRPTNSQTEPELAFNWIVELFKNWEENLRTQLTPLLVTRFGQSKLADRSLYVDALSAFITAFLPVVREKAEQFLSRSKAEPQYMSKFFEELLRFDERLREELKYDGGDIKMGWRGVTHDVLATWFEPWQTAEKRFALARYEEIIDVADNRTIDYDSGSFGRTKTTHSAAKTMDLFNSVTLLYQPLKSFSYKIRFLIDVQLAILDRFHDVLKDSLSAYVSTTSRLGRITHGVTQEDRAKLEGLGGLQSLCKVYGSADHIVIELNEQGNSAFFIDLWNDLQGRARGLDSADSLAGPMTSDEVKVATSSAVGSKDDGAVFDETSIAYKKLRSEAERLIIEECVESNNSSFRHYVSKPEWQVIGSDEDESLHITAELDQPLQALRERLELLHRTLSTAILRRIFRSVLSSLQNTLWYQIILQQRFTLHGGRQFYRDQEEVLSLIDSFIPGASTSVLGMPKIQEAARLLSLPLVAADGSAGVTVGEAYDRVMVDLMQAKGFMEEMGFNHLDVNELRRVLARRVEVGE